MITNERQYKITKTAAKTFTDAIRAAEDTEPAEGVHPRIHAAMIDGYRSQLEDLQNELHAYEELREGKVKRRTIASLLDLPIVLIEGRIAKHMTQRDLAAKLKLPEQQVQRYEGSRYSGVSLARLQEIADAIGLSLKNLIDFDLPQPATATGPSTRRRRTSATRRKATGRRSTRSRRAATASAGGSGGRTEAKRSTRKTTSTASRKKKRATASRKSTSKRKTTAKSRTSKTRGTAKTRARTTAKKTAAKRTKKTAAKRTSGKSRGTKGTRSRATPSTRSRRGRGRRR